MNQRTWEDYDAISKMTDAEMVDTWQEITREEAEYFQEAVPPIWGLGGIFLCGEIVTYGVDGPIYDMVIDVDDHYFIRPISIKAYIKMGRNHSFRYQCELDIRAKFYGICQACGNVLDVNGFCTNPNDND